jgi:C_GCAxxG_C_C family probable redox protein
MSEKVKQAVERFGKGFNCSQAILSSYSEQFGLDCGMAYKVATGFGGGMRAGDTCGAVTGAFMVLGLKYGNTTAENTQDKLNTYEKVEEFIERFKARNASVMCSKLLDCDMSTPEGRKQAQEKGLYSSLCPKVVQDAAEVLEEVLESRSD